MTELVLPHTIAAGQNVLATPLQENYVAVEAHVNNEFARVLGTWKTLIRLVGGFVSTDVVAHYYIGGGGSTDTAQSSGTSGDSGGYFLYLDDADYAITGHKLVMRVRSQVYTNATAPGASFRMTPGLYPISASGGTADLNSITLGTVVSGSTVTINSGSALSASSMYFNNSSEFDIPADGHYALGAQISGAALAANAFAQVISQLQYRWVPV